jgi:hypothetical protein
MGALFKLNPLQLESPPFPYQIESFVPYHKSNLQSLLSWSVKSKVEEKRENFPLRKLRKPGEEKEKSILLFVLKFPIQKGKKLFSEKTEKTWRKRKGKGSATFLLHLGKELICAKL